jgi:tetratricopeptide (TPR) repeat protein
VVQPGRNDPCPCGSGKKYKKCCGAGSGATAPGARTQPVSLDTAIVAFESGRYAAAAETAQAFARMHPNEPVAWQVLGGAAYYLGDVVTAGDAFERLVKLDKKNPEAWNNLAMMRCEAGDLEPALEAAKRAIKLQPDMAEAHNNLGNIYRAHHDHSQAEASYRRAIELGLETPQTYCNLGSVLQEQGDHPGAREAYEQAIAIDKNFAAAHSNLGGLLLIEGDMQAARESLEKAYALMPDDVDVLGNLGEYWQESGEIETARQYHQRALASQPDNAEVNFRLGQFYHEVGENNQARHYLERAVQSDPHHAKSLALLGEVALAQVRKADAEEYYRKAMQYGGDDLLIVKSYCDYLLKRMRQAEARGLWEKMEERYPENPLLLSGLAEYYVAIMQHDQAAKIYAQLVEEHPDNAAYLVNWSSMEERRHRVEEAMALARRAIEIEPDMVTARLALAQALSRGKYYKEALSELNAIDQSKLKNNPQAYTKMLFERATIEDRLKNYDAAYADFVSANAIKSESLGVPYSSEADNRYHQLLRDVYNKENLKQLSKLEDKNNDEIRPIFIVGFPRSGTTLLEQILASHSKVSAGDELVFIEETRNQIPKLTGTGEEYPRNLLDKSKPLTQAVLKKLRDYYIDRVREHGIIEPGSNRFTDKMPHNLFNLGFISLIFPEAPIIHITRHPMDACLSAFMANFGQGHRYTESMKSTATHYTQMMNLAEHYKRELEMNYLQIRYEDILDDAESKVRQVLEFVGLPWEDACLKFHETKRISKTASYAQVTQKLYTTSRYRYKNYYKHLEPLEPILRETMQRFGYTFEP